MLCEMKKNEERERGDNADDEQMEVELSDGENDEDEAVNVALQVWWSKPKMVMWWWSRESKKGTGPGSSAFPMTSQLTPIAS
uniref:Uncharacterized protein n=1 Tax=Globodera rostochiensis TaxID=31243 RepID=A0A914HWS4_GLORO